MIPNMKANLGSGTNSTPGREGAKAQRWGRWGFAPWLLCALALIPVALPAATNDLSGLLQKGLFEEEANRNLDAASAAYEALVKQLDKDRQIGATAIFRLGEVYRKQGKTNEAAAQYERIVRDFAEQTTLVTLSRQNLAGLGKGLSKSEAAEASSSLANRVSAEAQELARSESILAQLKGWDLSQLRRLIPALTPDAEFERLEADLKRAESSRLLSNQEAIIANQRLQEELKAKMQERAEVIVALLTERTAQLRKIVTGQLQTATAVDLTLPRTGAVATVVDEEEAEIRRIQAMIQNSPDLINATSGDPARTPLGRAAEKGQLRVADYLLNNGADVDAPISGGTPLFVAARNGHKKMVELLLARGAAVNAVDSERRTSLHVAVSRNYPAVMEALLAAKADSNAKDNNDNTPLMAAVRAGSRTMAQALLARGADPNVVSKLPKGTAMPDVSYGRTNYGSALHFAVGRGNAALTHLLLTNRADVTLRSIFGETALHVAAVNGSADVAALLMAAGADVNARGSEALTGGATPLHLATGARAADVVKLLLENKADPNPTAIYEGAGVTPLMLAANGTDVELIALLLKYKADPNQTDATGNTALLNAVRTRNAETVRALLAGGANPDTRRLDRSPGSPGYPVLMLAVTDFASKEVVAALIAAKADVSAADSGGRTPLHWAASKNRKDLVELLIQAGADVNLRDKSGRVPLDYAKENTRSSGGAVGMSALSPAILPVSGQASSSAAATKPDDVALLLRQHGALDELPDFTRIRIARQGLGQSFTVFSQNSPWTNQFTLLETVMRFYGAGSTAAFPLPGGSTRPIDILPFPDFGRIIIRRPNPKLGSKDQVIKVSLLNRSNAVDCAQDVPVWLGDVIEIPERVHALNDSPDDPAREMEWALVKTTAQSATPHRFRDGSDRPQTPYDWNAYNRASTNSVWTCLIKRVDLMVAGERTVLVVDSWDKGFLHQALSKTEARAALRTSSDLARVQVRRKNLNSKKDLILRVNVTETRPSELWLQDGDIIEVPDKQ